MWAPNDSKRAVHSIYLPLLPVLIDNKHILQSEWNNKRNTVPTSRACSSCNALCVPKWFSSEGHNKIIAITSLIVFCIYMGNSIHIDHFII